MIEYSPGTFFTIKNKKSLSFKQFMWSETCKSFMIISTDNTSDGFTTLRYKILTDEQRIICVSGYWFAEKDIIRNCVISSIK